MDILRFFRKSFWFGPADEEILNNYLEIQIKVENLKQLIPELEILKEKRLAKEKFNRITKEEYSTKDMETLFKRIVALFGKIFDEIESRPEKIVKSQTTPEMKTIIMYQKRLISILDVLDFSSKKFIKGNDEFNHYVFHEMKKNLDEVYENLNELVQIKESIKLKMQNLLEEIYLDSFELRKNFYVCSKKNEKQLVILKNLTFMTIPQLDKRSNISLDLHKDKTLDVLHYNLLYRDRNIHVIPSQYFKESLIQF